MVGEQIENQIEEEGLLTDNQHGFRSERSIMSALSAIQREWSNNTEEKLISGRPLTLPRTRDSGNDFRIPKIGSDNSRFSFILFLYPHVVPSRSSKRPSFLGADFRFWS